MDRFEDGLTSVTTSQFGLLSRLKILFGWTLYLKTRTLTEHTIGLTRDDGTEILLITPRWLQRKHPGAIEMTAPEEKEGDDDANG